LLRARGKTGRQGNWLAGVVVLSLGWVLIYAARTALSSALKEIGDYWGLSTAYLGFLSSSFFISYSILQIPTGVLADRFGSRRLLLAGFGVQAIGLFLGSASQVPAQFLMARILTGAGQATYFACQQAIISFTLPPEHRAAGTAGTMAGAGLGGAAGFLLGKFLSTSRLGWKMPFAVLGVLSAGYILLVLGVVPEPRPAKGARASKARKPEHPAAATTEAGAGSSVSKPPAVGPGWGFLGYVTASHFLSMYGFYLMLTWLPYYLETARGYKGRLSAVIPIVMPLIMAPATIIWGMISDRRRQRGFVLRIALPLAALATAAVPAMRSPVALCLALALYGATGKLVVDVDLVATVADSSPPETRGSTLAILNMGAALAMVAAPAVTGFVAQVTGSFDVSFYIAGLFNILALLGFMQGMKVLARAEGVATRRAVPGTAGPGC
jgi:MFS family permease